MDQIESHLSLSVVHVAADEEFRSFLSAGKGLALVPEPLSNEEGEALKADSGDFRKWMIQQHPDVPVNFPQSARKVVLRGGDIWLPLVFLASDVSVQVFLGLVANYLYDRTRGMLKTDRPRIHFSAVYEEHPGGYTKRLEFSGSPEDLSKVMRRFDANNFFHEKA